MNENPQQMIPEPILKSIRETDNIALFTHTHPDGDALGSLIGFTDILESLGKNVYAYLEEPVSHLYDFLPDQHKISIDIQEYRDFIDRSAGDILGIALDCGDIDRLGKSKWEIVQIHPFIVIDHHLSHIDFGDMRWVDARRSSTGEMVFELATALGAEISYNCAYNLYVAICTDTGSFKYESTRPRTLHIAAELLDRGVELIDIGNQLYDNYTVERLHLLQMVLSTIVLQENGKLAFMHVSPAMLAESGAKIQDVEGFIDFPRSLRSVKAAALIKESENGAIAVSLRAKGECDVAEVARRFEGGGHRNAAGFRCHGKTVEQVRAELHMVLREVMAG